MGGNTLLYSFGAAFGSAWLVSLMIPLTLFVGHYTKRHVLSPESGGAHISSF